MKVSVITICRNEENTIEETLLSIINQTYKNIELIVIDGKSTDRTLDIINKYRDRINVLVSENDNGIYDALNKGINLATGDVLNFMNAGDMFYDTKSVELAVKGLKKYSGAKMLFGNTLYFSRKNLSKFVNKNFDDIYNNYFFFFKTNINHQACFYKKELFDKYGLYDFTNFKLLADTDKNIKIFKNKEKIIFLAKPLSKYSLDGISSTNIKLHKKEKQLCIDKYYSRIDKTVYLLEKLYSLIDVMCISVFNKSVFNRPISRFSLKKFKNVQKIEL